MYFNYSDPWMIGLLVILVLQNIKYYLNSPSALLGLAISIPGILIGITFHEFAHAWVADKLGDDTPRRQGRLTLNPLAHLDPYGAILMLFAGFGWGKPVEINPNNFNRKVALKQGNAIVSFAGPAMNLILAVIFSIIYGLIVAFGNTFVLTTTGGVVLLALQYTITMNVGLAIFNLIPLPPLDGSKILMHFLPYNGKVWMQNNSYLFQMIFLLLVLTRVTSTIITPVIYVAYNGIMSLVAMVFGL